MVLSVCEQSRNMNLDFNTLSTTKNIIGDFKKKYCQTATR